MCRFASFALLMKCVPNLTCVGVQSQIPKKASSGARPRLQLVASRFVNPDSGWTPWFLTEIDFEPLNLMNKKNEANELFKRLDQEMGLVLQPTDFMNQLKSKLKTDNPFSYTSFLCENPRN
ncbi:hypothetical protein Ciccas_006079 [Cichlidogyrus casuarinus]|uniref:Uncharacterized protein n=1 Tax=Cichlidogyrus casuarinus TaxID=1844966 RepID=A0ABD2Q6U8_9PLAT